ncbi:hypothetical protein PYW07_015573 [Mythimna separata]|uniref:Xrn1 N-terminal domain-containing protein n=1 Tax=Mythimna separata TaxID=271217 RepID=A0AAD7YYR8_MYTSE|nr:hypothetical protein PYW07_015573 [Mythimna separata]
MLCRYRYSFDSNCITPATVFMARLHEQLKYFVKHKMSTDPLWSKVKVILSGHEVSDVMYSFDSNCITPATVFMARLHEQLKYFVKHKMSTDPLWSKVKVILSGHEVSDVM